MTTTLELFSQLRAKGVNIAIDGDALKLTAPKGVITAELRQEIATRKPEIVALLHSLLQTARTSESSMDRFERTSTMPLSFSQQRLWFLHQLDGADPSYNIPAVLRLSGTLDISALEGSIAEIIARHENLRTRFTQEEGSPRAVIDENSTWRLERVDLQDLPEADRDSAGLRRAIEFTKQPFDLSIGSLMRSSLITLNPETHLLAVSMHHIISDGWSLGVLVRELTELYSAAKNGTTPGLAPLAFQYADFAQWQRKWLESGELERQLPYWKTCLAGAPPIVEFPPDFRRPRSETSGGHRSRVSFPLPLSAALEQLSRDQNVTLFMLLLAAFKTLLYRYSGQEDLVVGTPSANRNRSELHPIIGFFVNNLVLRTNLGGNPTFLELLARVREVTLRAYDHQDVPFENLVQALRPERAIDHSPLFQTMFSFQNFPIDDLELPGLIITPVEMDCDTSRFDLTVEIYPRHGEMHAFFEYKTDLYHHETIAALQRHFLSLLQSIVADPAQPILAIPLLSAEEQLDLVVARNQTSLRYPGENCFHHRFEQNAREHPDRIAVTAAGSSLTYAQLNLRANQVADALIRAGAGPGKLIAICIDRGTDLLAGLLGILKTGAAYIPLDPTYPRKRIADILEDAEPVAVVITGARRALLSDSTATIICLDALPSAQADEYADPGISIRPDDLAYVIFTSGSTGRPKGVQIPHLALTNFLESMRHTPGLTAEDVLLAVTTVSFDIAALELYLLLYVGGRVHISVRSNDATALVEEFAAVRPTVMQATPATWQLMLSAGWTGDDRLTILCGGEALEIELARTLLPRCANLWNMYGPTETTIWSAAIRVTDATDETIPIGPPIANTSFYILDPVGQMVPVGVAGELHIGGHGVARGYLGRPDLTAERFLPDPFQPQSSGRLYRTGDLVRYRRTGEIEFLGRIDHQVKLRGFRIELGEIEQCLRVQNGIKDAVVVLRQDFGDKRLVGYVLADDNGKPPTQAALRDALRQALPEYMIPASIVVLDKFPRTPNGKLDRAALPSPDQAISVAPFVAAGTEEQRAVAGVFKGLLHLEKVSIQDNFFDIGAHSLLIAQAQDKLKRTLDPDLQIMDFFRYPTIESLAAFLRNRKPQHVVAGDEGNRIQGVDRTYA